MRKKIILSIISIILLFLAFYIYETKIMLLTVTIDQLELRDAKIKDDFDMLSQRYNMSQNDVERLEKDSGRFKYVGVAFSCDNRSFFKNIEGAEFRFENDQELPDIIIGSPDIGRFGINVLPNKINKNGINILIDPKDYSDEEIMEILKNVNIIMISKNNGNIKVESKPVSLVVGANS